MMCMLMGIVGCGEDEEKVETAKIVETNPPDGGEMFAGGNLTITFDKVVTEVRINGFLVDIAGTKATWKAQPIGLGKQALKIEWVDENGNAGSQEITLTIKQADNVVC